VKANNNTANAATSMQDGAWSTIAPEPTFVLTPDPALSTLHDKMDTYIEEMPKNADDTYVPPEPVMLSHVASTSHAIHVTLELYDSRATRHMTPYKEALMNYTLIMPKPINVANQHTFHTIAQGNLPIHVPNGKAYMNITLHDCPNPFQKLSPNHLLLPCPLCVCSIVFP